MLEQVVGEPPQIRFLGQAWSRFDEFDSAEEPARLNTSAGRAPSDAFSPETVARLRHEFRSEKIVGVRVPVTIEPRAGPPESSFLTIYLKRDPSLLCGHDFYLRGGIMLTSELGATAARVETRYLLEEDDLLLARSGNTPHPVLWRSAPRKNRHHRPQPLSPRIRPRSPLACRSKSRGARPPLHDLLHSRHQPAPTQRMVPAVVRRARGP